MRLGLISGGYPPDLDGIGDYTWWLAQTLAAQPGVESPVPVFTSIGSERIAAPGVEVFPFFDLRRPASFRDLFACPAIQDLDWLVLQYNPFSFGLRGWCPWVPRTLARLRRLPGGPRIAVMFHETFTQDGDWRSQIMRVWQELILRRVASSAAALFFSCEAYAHEVSRRSTQQAAVLPVGSNLPLPSVGREEIRRTLRISKGRIVLGSFGSAHSSRLFPWMADALRGVLQTGHDAELIHVGATNPQIVDAFRGLPFRSIGPLPGPEAANTLEAFDLCLSPFSDGLSTRRTSAIAALQTGIPMISTIGSRTDAVLREYAGRAIELVSVDSMGDFVERVRYLAGDAPARVLLGREGQSLFNRFFAWRLIARQLLEVLGAGADQSDS